MKISKLISNRNSTSSKDKHQKKNDIAHKVKMYNRNEKRDGYNPGQDEKVYESIKGSGITGVRNDFAYRHDQELKKKKIQVLSKLIPNKEIDWSKMNRANSYDSYKKRVNEGFYKNKDIDNQEKSEHKKRMILKYMDALTKSQHNITPEAKKMVLKRMKELNSEEVQDAYENYLDEDHESYKKQHLKSFQKAGVLKGSKTKESEINMHFGPRGIPSGTSERKYLEPDEANKHNRYDDNGRLRSAGKKRGLLSRLFRKEDVALSALDYFDQLDEGLLKNISRFFNTNRTKERLSDKIDKERKLVNRDQDYAAKRSLNAPKGSVEKKEYLDKAYRINDRMIQLGRRSSALKKDKSGNFFIPDWPKEPKELGYFKGHTNNKRNNIKEDIEDIEEGRILNLAKKYARKYSGIQRHSLNKKAYKDWWSEKGVRGFSNPITRVKATQSPNQESDPYKSKHGIRNSWSPKYKKSKYLSGKGLTGSEKTNKRLGVTTRSGDENYVGRSNK